MISNPKCIVWSGWSILIIHPIKQIQTLNGTKTLLFYKSPVFCNYINGKHTTKLSQHQTCLILNHFCLSELKYSSIILDVYWYSNNFCSYLSPPKGTPTGLSSEHCLRQNYINLFVICVWVLNGFNLIINLTKTKWCEMFNVDNVKWVEYTK